MSRIFQSTVALMLTATLAWAQEEPPATGDAGAAEPVADSPAAEDETPEPAEADDEAVDDSDLDSQSYEEDDDDFVPTEEIPTDQSIPFPSNI